MLLDVSHLDIRSNIEVLIIKMKNRDALIQIFSTMPDESFSYIVAAVISIVRNNVDNHGFMPESTQSFINLGKAINDYIGGDFIDPNILK